MATLKTTSIGTTSMPHTAVIIMVQLLAEGMISIWRIMRAIIITLVLTVTRTQVPTVTIISGLDHLVSAQMN